jgi:hypothetical protein
MRDEPHKNPMLRWKIIALTYGCDTCGATPGQPCMTSGGNKVQDVHVDRSRKAYKNNWEPADV